MPNISAIDLDRPGAANDVVSAVKAKMGSVPNIFATMAQSPAVLEGFLAFNGALSSGTLNAPMWRPFLLRGEEREWGRGLKVGLGGRRMEAAT